MKTYVVELPQSAVEKIKEIRQKLVERGLNVKAKDLASLIEFELTFLDETVEYCRKKLKECGEGAKEEEI
ncbi:hypothetical protein [Thermococcus sp.]